MKALTIEMVKSAMLSRGYVWFDKQGYDLNCIAIRETVDQTKATHNEFRDQFICAYRNMHGILTYHVWGCTTIPGLTYLKKPMADNGTACLVPGQYRKSHKLGMHKGYPALIQATTLKVYRDNNRDDILNLDPKKTFFDVGGLNIHHASDKARSVKVDNWSAACIVFPDSIEHQIFVKLVELQDRYGHGDHISLTLLDESEI